MGQHCGGLAGKSSDIVLQHVIIFASIIILVVFQLNSSSLDGLLLALLGL